ncbi:protein PLASTID MOVEMENT IMPAIRED 1-RELATED 1-like isoform X2 [Silene latifolia]
MVDFEETLMSKCTVYGAKNGPGSFIKYDPKHFLLTVSIFGAKEFDVGNHWVDLTRLLPLTLEELERDKCSGKWSTSFKLDGKARDATLHVSFGFLVSKDSLAELGGNIKLPLVLNLEKKGLNRMSFVADRVSDKGSTSLRRTGSVPSSLTSQCPDKFGWPKDVADFSNSIDMLYGKLEEEGVDNPAKFDLVYEHLESLKLGPNSLPESRKEFGGAIHEDGEVIVTDKGEEPELITENLDTSTVEVIDVADIFNGDGISSDEDTETGGKEVPDSIPNDLLIDKHNIPDIEDGPEIEPSSNSVSGEFKVHDLLLDKMGLPEIQELAKLEPSEDFMYSEIKVKNRGSKLVKSLSLDDIAKAVAEDFCNMWQESTPSTPSSSTNLESPRERLLRQFEEDMMICGSFFTGLDELEDEFESDHAPPSISSTNYAVDSVDLSPIINRDTSQSVNRASRSKIQAQTLEQLETQSLMQRWGLDEDAFLSSPHYSSGGFGSPIFVPPELEEPVGLPPLGEGLESLLQLKNGGLLRSMSPLLFKNAKNCGSLIMQTSKLIVLPAELSSDIIEILQGMASVGSERLSKKLNSLLPLDELSGRIMQQLAWEAEVETHPRPSAHHESDVKIRVEGLSNAPYCNSMVSSSAVNGIAPEHITAKGFHALALDSIEALLIEGLKIQSGMASEDPPSSIRVNPVGLQSSDLGVGGTFNYIDGLLDLSVSLDEWLEIDGQMIIDKNCVNDQTLELLRAHHARNLAGEEILDNEAVECGVLGANLALALLIQLRDPLRNYEPVGNPMLGLIQMERVFRRENITSAAEVMACLAGSDPLDREKSQIDGETENIESEKDDQERVPTFILKEVHIAGINLECDRTESWGSKRQQESGPRWLLASGMTQKPDLHNSKSRSLVRLPTHVLRKPKTRSLLWSISRPIVGDQIDRQLSTWDLHTRNPDLIFP